jgi:hypothetical protein
MFITCGYKKHAGEFEGGGTWRIFKEDGMFLLYKVHLEKQTVRYNMSQFQYNTRIRYPEPIDILVHFLKNLFTFMSHPFLGLSRNFGNGNIHKYHLIKIFFEFLKIITCEVTEAELSW